MRGSLQLVVQQQSISSLDVKVSSSFLISTKQQKIMSSTGTVSNFPPPMFGLGLWKVPKESCAEIVYLAIKMGVRHLDCACDYGNELETGAGITGK